MSDTRPRSPKPTDPPGRERVAPALADELRRRLARVDAGLRLLARELGESATSLEGWTIATAELARLREMLDLPPAPGPAPPGRAAGRLPRLPAATRATLVAGALLVTIGLGWLGFQRWILSGDVEAPSRAAEASERVEVTQVEGQVERQGQGGWEPVASGQLLRVDDSIRAGPASGATLAIGARSRLTLSEATQVTVREITAAVQRLRLSRGRISVDHQSDGSRVVVVESERGDAVARAGPARFSVLASGTALAVATETGVVRLQSGGRAVEVPGGRQAVSFDGQPPSPSAAIPAALLLRIARANGPRGACVVAGMVTPGSEVRVDGQPVEVGPDGRFTARVPGDARRREASVRTRDAAGRFEERRIPCADRGHDVSDFSVRWGRD